MLHLNRDEIGELKIRDFMVWKVSVNSSPNEIAIYDDDHKAITTISIMFGDLRVTRSANNTTTIYCLSSAYVNMAELTLLQLVDKAIQLNNELIEFKVI